MTAKLASIGFLAFNLQMYWHLTIIVSLHGVLLTKLLQNFGAHHKIVYSSKKQRFCSAKGIYLAVCQQSKARRRMNDYCSQLTLQAMKSI